MSIQLITFDLDDTLWDNRPVIEGAETAMRDWLMEHTPALGALPVEHLWAIRGEVLAAEPALKHRLSELRRRTLRRALEGVGYAAEDAVDLAEGAFQAMLHARHRITFFPDTVPTLERLAMRYSLGVITNGNADVRRLGLGRGLLEAAEVWSRSRGYREMASDAVLDNEVSYRAHLGAGYEVVDRVVQFRKSLA